MFFKTFPRNIEGSAYPRWEEISLTAEEEREAEELCRQEQKALFLQCLAEAKQLLHEQGLKDYQSDLVALSTALFEKRASHVIFYKENKAKEKFDVLFGKENQNIFK